MDDHSSDGVTPPAGSVEVAIRVRSGRRMPLLMLATMVAVGVLHTATQVSSQNARFEVRVDIKPGDEPTTVNPKRGGMLPVAILSSETFDVASINAASVRFERSEASPVRSMSDDVDADGRADLVFMFRNSETGIECGDDSATITGLTNEGLTFSGSEAIRTVGCAGDEE